MADTKPIPSIDESFSRIIIGRVGPLPKAKLCCDYRLTIMRALTRFPEAISLRNVKSKTTV